MRDKRSDQIFKMILDGCRTKWRNLVPLGDWLGPSWASGLCPAPSARPKRPSWPFGRTPLLIRKSAEEAKIKNHPLGGFLFWRPLGDSNPRIHRERVMS